MFIELREEGHMRIEQLTTTSSECESVSLGGIGVVFTIPGETTGGAFSIVEHPVKPGTLVPPHVHSREDELSYVVEGEFGARVGDQILHAGPGEYLFKPRNVPHTFWNAGPAPARLVEIIWPAGFERYFTEMAQLFPEQGPPDMGAVVELMARYGLTPIPDWIPELSERFGLTVLGF